LQPRAKRYGHGRLRRPSPAPAPAMRRPDAPVDPVARAPRGLASRRCAATGSRPTTGADLGAAPPARRSSERFAVRNALGAIQSLLVLGGSSDIGAALAERLVPGGCRRIVLAGRDQETMGRVAERVRGLGAEVAITAWDATDGDGHGDAVKAAWDALPGDGPGDVDAVVLAAGVLGDQEALEDDPAA